MSPTPEDRREKKEELKKELAKGRSSRNRRSCATLLLPPYLIQREINAEKEHMRRVIETYEAREKELATQIFVLVLPRLK
jgi:hypothetical protein